MQILSFINIMIITLHSYIFSSNLPIFTALYYVWYIHITLHSNITRVLFYLTVFYSSFNGSLNCVRHSFTFRNKLFPMRNKVFLAGNKLFSFFVAYHYTLYFSHIDVYCG